MMQAVLSNPIHPEYGSETIRFPIPCGQYAHCMERLKALEIGDVVEADCRLDEVNSEFPVLKRMESASVNVEELNYLAKRLEEFDSYQTAQFQAMAHKLELFDLKDIINLTFCCQQVTVITNFSDLDDIGRKHHQYKSGGRAEAEKVEVLDGERAARLLIDGGNGTVTPYGVVYSDGIGLEQVYDGRFFPYCPYGPNVIAIALSSKSEPEDTEHIAWLFLPMAQEEIDRAVQRVGIKDPAEIRLRLEGSRLPDEVNALLDMEPENLTELNTLAQMTAGRPDADINKLGAAVIMAQPQTVKQINNLAASLELFDFVPGIDTPTEYGKYVIRQSGHFKYDENLDDFYDYEKYGLQRMNDESGMLTEYGYIVYNGGIDLEKVMTGSQGSLPYLRESIHRRQADGIAAAKAKGVRFGRPRRSVPANFPQIVTAWEQGELSLHDALRATGVSEATFYRRLREYRAKRETLFAVK